MRCNGGNIEWQQLGQCIKGLTKARSHWPSLSPETELSLSKEHTQHTHIDNEDVVAGLLYFAIQECYDGNFTSAITIRAELGTKKTPKTHLWICQPCMDFMEGWWDAHQNKILYLHPLVHIQKNNPLQYLHLQIIYIFLVPLKSYMEKNY